MGRGRDPADFQAGQGVKWHDGKPFTAKDVKCTWDLLQGKAPRSSASTRARRWYRNLEEVAPTATTR